MVKYRILFAEDSVLSPEELCFISTNAELVRLNDPKNLQERAKDCDFVFTKLRHHFTRSLLRSCTKLRAIATPTTGLNHIDLEAAKDLGVHVISLKGETEYLKTITATAEHNWALVLAAARKLIPAASSVLANSWDRSSFFGTELSGKTLGIVGLGRLGTMTADYGKAFRMRVIANDIISTNFNDWIERVTLPKLFKESDVVSIHLPYDRSTFRVIDRALLFSMKAGSFLTNTSRGEVIDEQALVEALLRGVPSAAAIDVLENERNDSEDFPSSNPLFRYATEHDNLIVTPHIGGATKESVLKAERFILHKLAQHVADQP